MESNISTRQSLDRAPHHTPTRTALLAAIGTTFLALQAEAQTPSRRRPLEPVLLVRANSPEGQAAQAVRNGQPAPTPAPARSPNLDFSNAPTPTPVATPPTLGTQPAPQPTPAPIVVQPTNTELSQATAPSNVTTSIAEGSSHRRRDGWFGRIGVATVIVPNLFPRAEVADASNITISARNCSPERVASGPTGRYLCSVTVSGGEGHYTVTGANGAEVPMATGDGRNVNVMIPGTSISSLTVRTQSGATRTFHVTTHQDGNNRTFSSQVVGETTPAEQPVLVSVMPAVEAVVGRNMGPWEVSVAGRLGIGRTLSSPGLYYAGTRVNVSYHGGPRTLVAGGLQTGADFFIPENDMNTMVAVPVEGTFNLRTSANTQRARGIFGIAAGLTIPTNGNPVAFTSTATAGVEF